MNGSLDTGSIPVGSTIRKAKVWYKSIEPFFLCIKGDLEAITKTNDTATIFHEIISRKESLEDNAEILEQLEAFYKDGSSQQKVYNDALEIVRWYDDNNSLFGGLEDLAPVISEMSAILEMPVPFSKMSQLNNLVFKANDVKDQILERYGYRRNMEGLIQKKQLDTWDERKSSSESISTTQQKGR